MARFARRLIQGERHKRQYMHSDDKEKIVEPFTAYWLICLCVLALGYTGKLHERYQKKLRMLREVAEAKRRLDHWQRLVASQRVAEWEQVFGSEAALRIATFYRNGTVEHKVIVRLHEQQIVESIFSSLGDAERRKDEVRRLIQSGTYSFLDPQSIPAYAVLDTASSSFVNCRVGEQEVANWINRADNAIARDGQLAPAINKGDYIMKGENPIPAKKPRRALELND